MCRSTWPAILLTVVVLTAGCVAKSGEAGTDDARNVDQTSTNASASATSLRPASTTNASAEASRSNATATTNQTTATNETKQPDAPSNPNNCMRGMNMDGCTAAQADAYFNARKANAPPPDKELPAVTILLDAQGANPTGAFTLDEGTMVLLVEVYVNDTGPGPYFALGPDGAGDLMLDFVGPTETKTISLPGESIGIDPANPLAKKVSATIDMPTIGDWTLVLNGQGTNVAIEVRLIERFYM